MAAMWVAACASAPPKPAAPPVDLAKADALVAEGCYDCLIEAHDLYQKAAAIPRLRLSVLARLFESTVLIGLREKELALDPSARFAEATALAPELPPTYDTATYLKIATTILPDGVGTPSREMAKVTRAAPAELDAWRAGLGAGEGSATFRKYLLVGVECMDTRRPSTTASATASASGTDPQILVYRRSMCPRMDRVMLGGLIEADPRMIEAGVLVGRVRSPTPTSKEIADAKTWLAAGDARWPNSPVVTYALGSLYQTVGDCRTALTYYDRTLALRPLHEDGHLGRLICLSYKIGRAHV